MWTNAASLPLVVSLAIVGSHKRRSHALALSIVSALPSTGLPYLKVASSYAHDRRGRLKDS